MSSRKYPRCAIGPPNEVSPSRRKTSRTSATDPRGVAAAASGADSFVIGISYRGAAVTRGRAARLRCALTLWLLGELLQYRIPGLLLTVDEGADLGARHRTDIS